MKIFLAFFALLICHSTTFALPLAGRDCTLIHCEHASKEAIQRLQSSDLHNLFHDDPGNIEAFKQEYQKESRYRSQMPSFEEWYEESFLIFSQAFKKNKTKDALINISNLETRYHLSIDPSWSFGDHYKGHEELKALAAKPGACQLKTQAQETVKDCSSQKASCVGAAFYVFTMGYVGAPHCQEARSRCTYLRDWNIMARYRENGFNYVSTVEVPHRGEASESRHRAYFFHSLAKKAKRDFDQQEKELKEILKSLPACR